MNLLFNPSRNFNERELMCREPENIIVRTLLPDILDSCCQTEEVTRDILLTNSPVFNMATPEIGMSIPIALADSISFREVASKQTDCCRLSSALFGIPLVFSSINKCLCPAEQEFHTLTIIRSATLQAADNSTLSAPVKEVLLLQAFITDIDFIERDQVITVSVSFIFRTELQQIMMREFDIMARPVCETRECHINIPHDRCDDKGCPVTALSCGFDNDAVLVRSRGLLNRRQEAFRNRCCCPHEQGFNQGFNRARLR